MSFWASKINGTPAPPVAPPSRNLYLPSTIPPPEQTPYNSPEEYVPRPSLPLSKGGVCPGCGSDLYPAPIPVQNGFRQGACGACGYHPSFQQTGYGIPSLGSDGGRATPARQTGDSSSLASSIAVLKAGGGTHIASL